VHEHRPTRDDDLQLVFSWQKSGKVEEASGVGTLHRSAGSEADAYDGIRRFALHLTPDASQELGALHVLHALVPQEEISASLWIIDRAVGPEVQLEGVQVREADAGVQVDARFGILGSHADSVEIDLHCAGPPIPVQDSSQSQGVVPTGLEPHPGHSSDQL
jgi:hypothetical protein